MVVHAKLQGFAEEKIYNQTKMDRMNKLPIPLMVIKFSLDFCT